MANQRKITIPKTALETFISVSSKNFAQNSDLHIETLAFIIGYQDGERIVPTEILFPKQDGTQSKVDDNGKIFSVLIIVIISRITITL